jgi:hypothetical protein
MNKGRTLWGKQNFWATYVKHTENLQEEYYTKETGHDKISRLIIIIIIIIINIIIIIIIDLQDTDTKHTENSNDNDNCNGAGGKELFLCIEKEHQCHGMSN